MRQVGIRFFRLRCEERFVSAQKRGRGQKICAIFLIGCLLLCVGHLHVSDNLAKEWTADISVAKESEQSDDRTAVSASGKAASYARAEELPEHTTRQDDISDSVTLSEQVGSGIFSPQSAIQTGTATAEQFEGESRLYAKSAALLDADTGRVLWGREADLVMPMASTTKIMTCIIALEYGDPETVCTVSSYAASMPKVKAGFSSGEEYRLQDLLYALMLESHNDAAVVIAEGVAGSVEGFAALMNQKAEELGCKDTHFVTPNGLDAEGHQTTAAELGRIAAYAMQNERFCEIIGTRFYTYTDVNGKHPHSISNKNGFLDQYSGCIGIKTGYTGKAGYCYVGCVRRADVTLISVVLACGWPPHKTYKWSDCRRIFDYGFAAFHRQKVVEPMHSFQKLPVKNGILDTITVSLDAEETMLVGDGEEVSLVYHLPEAVEAPIAVGAVIGDVELRIGEACVRSYPVVADSEVEEFTFSYALEQVMEHFFGWTVPFLSFLCTTS